MKLGRIEVSESVRRLFYRCRFTQITWKAFSILSLTFSGIRHVGRDINQCHDLGIVRGFGDYLAAITVSDNNTWSVLLSDHALGGSYVFSERRLRLLHDADPVTVLNQHVINTCPP